MGVTKAVQMAEKAKQEHPNEPVYILGDLVHNERIIASLRQKGLTIIEGDLFSLERQLSALPDQSVIVFTAHGHAPKWDEIAREKKMKIYDATCVFVDDNEKMIAEEINRGGEVFYIGVKNHAEANAAIAINPDKVHLVTGKGSINPSVCHVIDPLIVCQTTESQHDIQESLDALLTFFPKAKIAAKRCLATEMRQDNLSSQEDKYDLVVVLGSSTSNNTKRLYDIAKRRFTKAEVWRILSVDELKEKTLRPYRNALLVSGASSAANDVIDVKNYLENN